MCVPCTNNPTDNGSGGSEEASHRTEGEDTELPTRSSPRCSLSRGPSTFDEEPWPAARTHAMRTQRKRDGIAGRETVAVSNKVDSRRRRHVGRITSRYGTRQNAAHYSTDGKTPATRNRLAAGKCSPVTQKEVTAVIYPVIAK